MNIPTSVLASITDIPALVESLDLQGKDLGKDYLVRCVRKEHEDRTPSCYIRKNDGVWKCFGCQHSGNVLDLVKEVKGLEFPQNRKYVMRYVPDHLHNIEVVFDIMMDRIKTGSIRNNVGVKADISLRTYEKFVNTKPVYLPMGSEEWSREVYDWCRDKGVDPDLVRQSFKIYYCKFGKYAGRVIIPIVSKGVMVDFQARFFSEELDDKGKKDLFIPGISVNNYLYNFDSLDVSQYVGILEGPVDVLRLWPYFRNTVGCMGSSIQIQQVELLRRFPGFIIMPDPDKGGMTLLKFLKDNFPDKPIYLRFFDKTKVPLLMQQLVKVQ